MCRKRNYNSGAIRRENAGGYLKGLDLALVVLWIDRWYHVVGLLTEDLALGRIGPLDYHFFISLFLFSLILFFFDFSTSSVARYDHMRREHR